MKVAAKQFVLDASVTVAWCFDDESTPFTEGILDLLSGGAEGVAPGIWPLEIANALLVAERRKRISVAQVTALLGRIVQLPVWVETIEPDRAFSQVLSVARQHQLTEYDAAYMRGKEGIAKFLGGWQLSPIYTYHSGFPWTPIDNNCLQTPGQQFICPIRPVGYSGGAGTNYSNDKFLTPKGNFPGGGANFFTLTPPGPPCVGRNSFRGPRYQSIDLTFGKSTPLPRLGEGGNLQIRMNVFNVFNHLNLAPFTFNTRSTIVQDPFFGTAGDKPALAGRVVELQARVIF